MPSNSQRNMSYADQVGYYCEGNIYNKYRLSCRGLDDETKLALALSASLASHAEDKEKLPTKTRGRKRKAR